jgi:hypothetical protein
LLVKGTREVDTAFPELEFTTYFITGHKFGFQIRIGLQVAYSKTHGISERKATAIGIGKVKAVKWNVVVAIPVPACPEFRVIEYVALDVGHQIGQDKRNVNTVIRKRIQVGSPVVLIKP